jgi:hypothetical protein
VLCAVVATRADVAGSNIGPQCRSTGPTRHLPGFWCTFLGIGLPICLARPQFACRATDIVCKSSRQIPNGISELWRLR